MRAAAARRCDTMRPVCGIGREVGAITRRCSRARQFSQASARIDHVSETQRRRSASGSAEARHESERCLPRCRRADHHAVGKRICHARHDAGRAAGGKVSPRSIPPAVGGGEPARRLVHKDFDQRPAGRQARRPPRRAQGQYLPCRRADDGRRPAPGRLCAGRRCDGGRAHPRCRRRDRRQGGVRILLRVRRQPYQLDRSGAQSAQTRLHHRRVVVRQRGGCRRRRRRYGDRRRPGRLDPHPGQPLRHRRIEADLRPCSLLRHRSCSRSRSIPAGR